jgi:cell division protein FtsX
VAVDRALTASSRTLQALVCLIGVALIVSTVARGGGPLALGVILGAMFVVLGAARLWISARRERAEPR